VKNVLTPVILSEDRIRSVGLLTMGVDVVILGAGFGVGLGVGVGVALFPPKFSGARDTPGDPAVGELPKGGCLSRPSSNGIGLSRSMLSLPGR
jgi:hypothetical protein